MDGAFDVTIAPLVRCWGFMGGSGTMPEPGAIDRARALVGPGLVELDERASTVRFRREGVMIDLGAIGKGYAIECAVEVLRDAGVTSALLHGGTSTVYGLGTPPESSEWKVAIGRPLDESGSSPGLIPTEGQPPGMPLPTGDALLAVVALRDEALSVSAVWGRSFVQSGKSYGHVIDPRTGQPVAGALLAAVALPSATGNRCLEHCAADHGGGWFGAVGGSASRSANASLAGRARPPLRGRLSQRDSLR
jgi:thiamine biosynthesis lipoprotein